MEHKMTNDDKHFLYVLVVFICLVATRLIIANIPLDFIWLRVVLKFVWWAVLGMVVYVEHGHKE